MITEITYYDPRQKRTRTETLNNAEDWRVQAMVQKLRREGKVIRDVKHLKKPVSSSSTGKPSDMPSYVSMDFDFSSSSSDSSSSDSGGGDYGGGGGDFSGGGCSGDW